MHIPENFSQYLLSFNLLTFHQQITIVPEYVKKTSENECIDFKNQ